MHGGPLDDEAERIADTVKALKATAPNLGETGLELLVYVVDDGSADGSGTLARDAGADIIVVCSSDDEYADLAPEIADYLILSAAKKHLILFWLLFEKKAVRISPPLTISIKEIEKGCQTILEVLNDFKQ